MPGCVSCWLYLLLEALENFDILLDLRSREISNFPKHLEINAADGNPPLSLQFVWPFDMLVTTCWSFLKSSSQWLLKEF